MSPNQSQKLLNVMTPDLNPVRSRFERMSVASQALGTTCQGVAASTESLGSALNRGGVTWQQDHRSTRRNGRLER